MGNELKEIDCYKEITAVVPVPLHRSRLRKRGYNQVEKFGKATANFLEVPYKYTVLVKKSVSTIQTIKKRFARWGNIDVTFLLENTAVLEQSHVLLVDDLVTTGATLEACATKLLKIPGVKVSLATMAITH
ncbi:hypothetical protein GCM10007103_16610 [Salinimicrobium marinum]|uniref:Phosphoribosyltransferase domain-containing protein n=1 Tax=Salinimicrobium marinum TaxID=680283 RepID=A0A918SF38_9FLAO|nr:phosphoribosyltransferase family protein [Salinimicrobium marinum]GHA35843.1 hypothetical protein GCM10007103_16610 [Salinimicrobium marinum]